MISNRLRKILQKKSGLFLSMIAIVAIIGAVIIANYIKRLLLNLEPEEIASLYDQREKILQSTHEGIVAVDENGDITMMNVAAQNILREAMNIVLLANRLKNNTCIANCACIAKWQ